MSIRGHLEIQQKPGAADVPMMSSSNAASAAAAAAALGGATASGKTRMSKSQLNFQSNNMAGSEPGSVGGRIEKGEENNCLDV